MKIPQETASNYENAPVGTHAARCVSFIDLGSHQEEYQGKPKASLTRKVRLGFELPLETMNDGRPFTVSKRYTWSMNEKAILRQHLESWRGKPFEPADFGTFDIRNVLGKECSVSIKAWERDGKSGTGLDHVGKAMKGITIPPAINPLVYFSLERDEFSLDTFQALPEKMQEFIRQSAEWNELMGGNVAAANVAGGGASPNHAFDDSIPFAPEFR